MINFLRKYFIFIGLFVLIAAGVSKGVMDKLQFHYDKSVFSEMENQQFWNPEISWKNKYQNYDEGDTSPAFFGSTTFYVGVTDAWHLFQTIQYFMLFAFMYLLALEFLGAQDWEGEWKYLLFLVLIARIVFGVAFHASFHWIL